MKKVIPLLSSCLLGSSALVAQDKLFIRSSDRQVAGVSLLQIDSIGFSDEGTNTYLYMKDGIHGLYTASIDSLTFGQDSQKIRVRYTGGAAEIENPLAYEGVSVTTEAAEVTVHATTDREVKYILSIGDETHSPVIQVTTSGKKFLVSGSGQNADYGNPKAIKSEGDLTVNNGTITVRTSQDGGEGLESKNILTINGGEIDAQTYDDAINAAKSIVINRGKIYCYSSGNDGIDSNGTLTVNGGIVIASGTSSPEEGFDCDRNTFKITGGILIGTGGSSSSPTANVCTQPSLLYGGGGTSGQIFHIQDTDGHDILTYMIPRPYTQMTLLFSSGALTANTDYTIYTGGTVTEGSEFHGLYDGASYTGGTVVNTFTTSSTVTTVGNTGGGPGGGGGSRPGGWN